MSLPVFVLVLEIFEDALDLKFLRDAQQIQNKPTNQIQKMSDFKAISAAKSFEIDLNRLLDDFSLSGDKADFSEFIKIWKKKRFYLVFHGVLHVNQLHEFVDDMFELCLKKFESETEYLKRVGLIFVLYACYFKQPDEEVKFNIRLQESHHEQIRSFLNECRSRSDYEVIYCWRKLLAEGAIDLVCQLNYYGPWFIRRQKYDRESILLNTVDEQFVKQMKDLDAFQADYDRVKLNIEDCEGKEEIESLDLVEEHKTLYSDYLKKFEDLKKKFNKS